MELPENSLRVIHIPEPLLGFGYGQICEHPKDGLYLYGPTVSRKHSAAISVGVIGTTNGLAFFDAQLKKMAEFIPIPPRGKTDKEHRLHLSNFPGLEETFGLVIDQSKLVKRTIALTALDNATLQINHHEAVNAAVEIYLQEIDQHEKNEELNVDIWVLVLPELIFERCKPQSKRTGLPLVKGNFGKRQKIKSDLPLLADVIDLTSEAIFDDVPDFHRQVKAHLLKRGKTSQLLRETTLAPGAFLNRAGYPTRTLQDSSSVAWNLGTGLYYKTQPEPPWKLVSVRPSVCYIGLVFKLIPNHPQEHACCAAQMFLNEGDGIVFRGANGPWQTAKNEFHLKKQAARDLITTVVETFLQKHGAAPKELFIHGRTKFNDEEWAAFAEACPPETNLVGVRIQTTSGDVKLFRDGDYPVLRGTALVLDHRNAYLWTNGFLPRLDTYIGPETPNPLLITITRSTNTLPVIENVLTDIMGLTKINYNACNFSDGLPVTVRFADKVGDVLVMGAAQGAERQPFKYYI